jgi:hypothetical protein
MTPPPPFFDPENAKVDGLAFLGLSLTRQSARGHPASTTHQTAFDLDRLTDRDYQYVLSTSDDGWLAGGGEPPDSSKLTATDSAHVELLHVSTYDPTQGGISQTDLLQAFVQSKILIPEVTVVPTAVIMTDTGKLQVRFDMEAAYHDDETTTTDAAAASTGEEEQRGDGNDDDAMMTPLPALPVNWQLRFIHNQLFRYFHYPSRYCRDPFSCDLANDVSFRSDAARAAYLERAGQVVARWRCTTGPRRLDPPSTRNIRRITTPMKQVHGGMIGSSDRHRGSGVWLFTDRRTPTHLVEPNFLPPYNTLAKRAIIFAVLSEEWDPHQRVWQPAPPLPKPELIIISPRRRARNGSLREGKEKDKDANNDDHQIARSSGWGCGVMESAMCAVGK